MATDHDIESILSTSDFRAAPTIPLDSPVEEITQAVIEYTESGIPCVITGFHLVGGDVESPFRQPEEWVKSMYTIRSASTLGPAPIRFH